MNDVHDMQVRDWKNNRKARTCVNENALLMYPRTHASGAKSHPSSTWEPPLVRTYPEKMCVKAIGGAARRSAERGLGSGDKKHPWQVCGQQWHGPWLVGCFDVIRLVDKNIRGRIGRYAAVTPSIAGGMCDIVRPR
jgi:hypothetical protein